MLGFAPIASSPLGAAGGQENGYGGSAEVFAPESVASGSAGRVSIGQAVCAAGAAVAAGAGVGVRRISGAVFAAGSACQGSALRSAFAAGSAVAPPATVEGAGAGTGVVIGFGDAAVTAAPALSQGAARRVSGASADVEAPVPPVADGTGRRTSGASAVFQTPSAPVALGAGLRVGTVDGSLSAIVAVGFGAGARSSAGSSSDDAMVIRASTSALGRRRAVAWAALTGKRATARGRDRQSSTRLARGAWREYGQRGAWREYGAIAAWRRVT